MTTEQCKTCLIELDLKALTDVGVTECTSCGTKYAQEEDETLVVIDEMDTDEYLGG